MSDAPDDCPVHELAVADPGATVHLYDEQGSYIGPASAEMACDGHHLGTMLDSVISRQLREYPVLRGAFKSGEFFRGPA